MLFAPSEKQFVCTVSASTGGVGGLGGDGGEGGGRLW